jgi:hypothetical protein
VILNAPCTSGWAAQGALPSARGRILIFLQTLIAIPAKTPRVVPVYIVSAAELVVAQADYRPLDASWLFHHQKFQQSRPVADIAFRFFNTSPQPLHLQSTSPLLLHL